MERKEVREQVKKKEIEKETNVDLQVYSPNSQIAASLGSGPGGSLRSGTPGRSCR